MDAATVANLARFHAQIGTIYIYFSTPTIIIDRSLQIAFQLAYLRYHDKVIKIIIKRYRNVTF